MSLYEISSKRSLGKLELRTPSFLEDVERRELSFLPVTARHAWAGGALPLHHRDPFDRILVAQAQLEGMTIVTRDAQIGRYQVAILPA